MNRVSEIFADTAGWANFFIKTEPFHQEAVQLMDGWHAAHTKVVTSNYVLVELIALFTSPLRIQRSELVDTIEAIQSADWVDVVHIDPALDRAAWELLKARRDKQWSLVDCSSMVIMKERQITDAFTSDKHFEQAGLTRLLV